MTTLGRWLADVRKPIFLKWAAVVIALGVCAVGIYLLWGVWDGKPAAAAFTRVGGATRVETALEASRFWLTPPQLVVETQTDASPLMLGAAKCAMAHDAPLLFTSPDPARQRLVDATINDWRAIETTHPELITIQSQRDIWRAIESTIPELNPIQTLPKVITIQSPADVKQCLANGDLADVGGLSTLEVSNPVPLPRPPVSPRQTLAPVVVFAAAIEPGDPPDVAVGLALAAHMARANGEKVSLVVVPHYLESDLELENALQSQHEQVTGGVVLGETPTVPEDTRVLLRQLLTSTDRQGVAAQVQANLGSVGSLIAALLALAGLATAAGVAAPVVIERLERAGRERAGREYEKWVRKKQKRIAPARTGNLISPNISRSILAIFRPIAATSVFIATTVRSIMTKPKGRLVTKESDWINGLGKNREVTVWLRSGQQVTGTIERQIPAKTRDATVFRIKKAPSVPTGVSPPRPEGAYVLVSVKDIELIAFNDSESEAANANRPSG